MPKSTRRKVQLPSFQPGDVVSTRYGIGVILHAFIGSVHRNRQITYSLELKGKLKPRVLFERELTPCALREIAAPAPAPAPAKITRLTASRTAQLAAA
jgi:hypothetical protein